MFKFFVDHTFLAVLLIVAIWLTIRLTVHYWRKYNWAWGILVLIGCFVITPFGMYFIHKLGDI